MSFYGLGGAGVGILALFAVAIVVAAYTIRWRLPRRVVATTVFWRAVATARRGGWLGRLENTASLALNLAIVGSLVLAIGRPRLGCQSQGGRAVVIVLDRSASMATRERLEPRIEEARRQALTRLDRAAATDAIGLVLAGGEPLVARPLGFDLADLRREIGGAKIRPTASRLAEATATACALLTGAAEASLVVISDGTEPFGACPSAQIETLFVGTARPNVGITAFSTASAPRDPRTSEAFVAVLNASPSPATAELRLSMEGSLLRVVELKLEPGQEVRRTLDGIPVGGTGLLTARLSKVRFDDGSSDALTEDDQAFTLMSQREAIPVALVGDNGPVGMVLAANPRYRVTPLKAVPTEGFALTVIAGPIAQPLPPGGRYLLIDPRGPGAPLRLGAKLADPKLTAWREDHPILRHVILSDILVGEATATTLPASAVPLMSASEGALAYAMVEGPTRIVGLAFDPTRSNLPLRVGFPVLIYNALDWLRSAAEEQANPWQVRTTAPIEVTPPEGKPYVIEPIDGLAHVDPSAPGFYQVSRGGKLLRTLAASVADRGESALTPRVERVTTIAAGRQRDRDPAPLLLLAALALALLEWITFHRRVTV